MLFSKLFYKRKLCRWFTYARGVRCAHNARTFDIEYNVSGRTKEKNKNTFQYKNLIKVNVWKNQRIENEWSIQAKTKIRLQSKKWQRYCLHKFWIWIISLITWPSNWNSHFKKTRFQKKTHHIYIKQYQLCIKWQIMPNMAV